MEPGVIACRSRVLVLSSSLTLRMAIAAPGVAWHDHCWAEESVREEICRLP